MFESVVILDSGKTPDHVCSGTAEFESVVILDSGKTVDKIEVIGLLFESVVILDSGKTEALDRGLYFHRIYAIRNTLAPDVPESYDWDDVQHLTQSLYEHAYWHY